MTSRNLSTCGGCECPVNLILGPVIRTPLLDQMSIQLQFTLWNTDDNIVTISLQCLLAIKY